MEPKYQIIRKKLLEAIQKEKWRSGDLIPADRCLAEEFGVSKGTVKQAVLELVREGYLVRVQGKGSFVTEENQRYRGRHFTELRADFTSVEKQYELCFEGMELTVPEPRVSELLQLHHSQKVILLRRSAVLEGSRTGLLTSFLPYKFFSKLLRIPGEEFSRRSLPAILEQNFGFKRHLARELLYDMKPDARSGELLRVAEGDHVQYNELIHFDEKEVPYEYRVSVWYLKGTRLYREHHYSQ